MKLTHLRAVAAIAEHGSLRAAARTLGVSQPALTRTIRELEHELGVALFERRPKGAVLTSMGQILLRRAGTIDTELRRAHEEIEQAKGHATGSVSVALSPGSHIALLPWAFKRFQARFPDLFVRIAEGLFPSLENALKDGAIDFYVGPLSESPPGNEFVVEKLYDNTRVIFGRKGHPLARARSLRQLADARWITTSVTSSREAELYPLFERHGLPRPKIQVEAPSALAMIMTAANSDLLMVLPRQWLDFPATLSMLQSFELQETLPGPPICIARSARLPLTPAAEFFCDMFRRSSQHYATAAALISAPTPLGPVRRTSSRR